MTNVQTLVEISKTNPMKFHLLSWVGGGRIIQVLVTGLQMQNEVDLLSLKHQRRLLQAVNTLSLPCSKNSNKNLYIGQVDSDGSKYQSSSRGMSNRKGMKQPKRKTGEELVGTIGEIDEIKVFPGERRYFQHLQIALNLILIKVGSLARI